MEAFGQHQLQSTPVKQSVVLCHRSYLEQRCAERGYTLEEVMPCVLSQHDDHFAIDILSPFYPRLPREVVAADSPKSEERGPGTELKKLLAGWPFYVTASPDCSCNRVAREMDAWGPDECEKPERSDYIIAAMRENAAKRGLPFIEAAGRFLIRRAIANARKSRVDP